MLATALFLTGYNLLDEYRAGKTTDYALETLHKQMPEITDSSISSSPNESELPDYVVNPDMEMPTEKIEGNYYIGVLEIPALELSLPVMSEWSYPGLKIAPCRYQGSAYTGNLVIAAHNYRTHFGYIGNLTVGDSVMFKDVKGRCFLYEVAAVESLEATATVDMVNDEWGLTLFTCTLGGTKRVTVRCVRAE